MGPIINDHLLSVITFLPLATGLLLLASGVLAGFVRSDGLPPAVWRAVALSSSLLTFVVSVVGLWGGFDPEQSGFQFVERTPWMAAYGVNYFVGVDGVSLVLVLLTSFLMPVILLASWNDITKSLRTYVFFMLFLETGMLGAFVSLNLLQFYIFWEVMLVPMYFIIGIWGGPRRVYAAIKFFLFTMFGSLLMLVAMLVVYWLNFDQGGVLNLDLVSVPETASGLALLDTAIPVTGEGAPWFKTQFWLFAAFALAFGIKVPMVPFHTWLPDAHVEAPTAGSVVLAGVLLKMGTYGFVRFALPLFPVAAVEFVPFFFALSLIGIVYGSLVAMVQQDVKRLVAYSSVAHLGFVMLGIFALNLQGVTGSVLQMVNHGLSTGALFLLVGFLYERRHTRQISDFGGIARPMPVYAALFGIVTMSSIGLPALNGFVGEFLILLGTFAANAWVAAAAALGVILAAAYMLWMYRRVFFGPIENPENRGLIDLSWRERTVMVAMIVPIVWIGVHPEPLLRRIEPSVMQILSQMQQRGADLQIEGVAVASLAASGPEQGGAAEEAMP
ncbi:MAG: NADH-quinone oxidoreductase subunit M [Proteobacteria bacterium]|nr:NADH-quinone oxidoreductase subunit M [Pseudomonadota bacterium]MCZ6784859.1 NADH-quinone oxidoreductase subunit M [Pseudomonadota bacterium]